MTARDRPCPQCQAPTGAPCTGFVNGKLAPIPVHHSMRRSPQNGPSK